MKFSSLKFTELIDSEKKRKRITNNLAIASELGVSKQTIENIMNGKTKPSIEVLCEIAMKLGVDITAFFEYGTNNVIAASPITLYEPESELSKCYKIMFEQQKEIADQQKEMTELVREIEKLKKPNAPDNIANVG